MSYIITSTNPNSPSVTVQDQMLNTETNLTFIGKNYSSYGPIIAEDFLRLLENFASASPPSETTQGVSREGQLWYDTNAQQLMVCDGDQNWNPVASIKKSSSAPAPGNVGNIWVDLTNKQLYLDSGTNWLLVGPQYSDGSQTGAQVLNITDTSDVVRSVTGFYSSGTLIAIASSFTFTPKATILGFPIVNQGINLNLTNATSTTSPTKFWGRASEADALNVNGTTVTSSSFLRSDIQSIANQQFSIRSDGGLKLGGDLSFSISLSSSATVFNSNSSGKGINFLLKTNSGRTQSALYLNANSLVGIGPNNTAPETALDVAGIITVKNDTVSVPTIGGQIVVNGTADISDVSGASIKTLGGLSVAKSITVGETITVNSFLYFNNINSSSQPIAGPVLLPGTTSASGYYDIGSVSSTFRNVYATSFGKPDLSSDFYGKFNGTFTGQFNGAARSLTSPTTFSIAGEISSTNSIAFDGTNGTVTFNTVASPTFISSRTEVTDSYPTDVLLISRSTTNALTNVTTTSLYKTTKKSFVSNLPTVPIGAIFPFAGSSPPAGYLLCDGSEVPTAKYASLFTVISYTYKPAHLLTGISTFALPDLRGRFALGADNMNNRLTVTSPAGNQINAGGGSANRVTDVVADTVGAGSGKESKALSISNLPDHSHNMNSGTAQYYAVGAPNVPDSSSVAGYGLSTTANSGAGYPYSGGVFSASLGQPVNLMNPYLTINYIIYTGVVS